VQQDGCPEPTEGEWALGKADPGCAWCKGTGERTIWDIDPETDEYGWVPIRCECVVDD